MLRSTKTHIRRGQLTMIAAGPGTGKSALVQAWLQRGDDVGHKDTVLYFSADSDSMTMYKRAAAIATGYTQDDIEDMMERGDTAGLDAHVNEATKHMWFDYKSSPDAEDIHLEVAAYLEIYGRYPTVIVMDNLKNCYAGEGTEFEALEQNCEFLHELGKDTNAAVIALHHVSGLDNENGTAPIPMSGVRGRVSKVPEVILTLHRTATHLNISPVKNRNGKAQASGQWFLQLTADLSRMAYSG